MNLTKDTVIGLAPDIIIEINTSTDIKLKLDSNEFIGNSYTLAILDTFSTPKSFVKGLEELKSRIKGRQAWIELTCHVRTLFNSAILQNIDLLNPVLHSHHDRYDAPPVHIRMLNDRKRTDSFQRAIREVVTPEDIVLDIGAGTGVLAITAAMAGAKHVYAIESSSIARLARQNIEKNGLSDRITLIEGRSANIELPEKADVMVSEMIGDDPLRENILEITSDSIKRHLKPNARLIPDVLGIYGLPVTVPYKSLKKHIFTPETVTKWLDWYGIDFSALTETTKQQDHSFSINAFKSKYWPRLSDPVLLKEIKLINSDSNKIESIFQVQANDSGLLNGIIVYFNLKLSKTVEISLHPDLATPDNHWVSKVWVPGNPPLLETGNTFELFYKHGRRGSSFEIRNIKDEIPQLNNYTV